MSKRVFPPPCSSDGYEGRTLAAYRARAAEVVAEWRRLRPPSRFLRRFAQALPPGSRVLDYGCGIGADLAWLHRQGFRVDGVEGVWEFTRQARRRCPGVTIQHARFEAVRLPAARYEGIWCHAALMHVPPEAFPRHLHHLQQALTPCGVLGMTLAWGRTKAFTQQDWIPGRYLAGYTKPEVVAFFQEWAVAMLAVVSHDGRQGRWIHLLASPRSGAARASTQRGRGVVE